MPDDYYQTLGVARGASQTEIEKAYRDLARKCHPDLNPDDKTAKQKFQQLQRAFEVLKDPEKREMYDRYGSSFESMGAAGPGGNPFAGGAPGGVEFDFSDFFGERFGRGAGSGGVEEILREMGGGGRRRQRAKRGGDIQHELRVPFGTSVLGGEAQITVQRANGKVETLQVKIPAGIDDGKKIRLRGQGEPPTGRGEHGDILITVRVSPHPLFRRSGNNLELRVPVTMAEAALGAKIEIPSPSGAITLSVPPGTSSGAKLRVRGHGVQPTKGTVGDLLAEIQIMSPKGVDDDAIEVLRQLDDRYDGNPRDNLQW
ncbi:MAG: J domain-containing protein [Planctomycetota bacterium]|nr:J domain-containing protein [Planctomycetota bacterium]